MVVQTNNPFKQSGNIINLIGIIVAIILVLLASKKLVTVIGVSVIFICASLIIWHLPWVENYKPRRIFLMAVLALACVGLTYATWPEPVEHKPSPPISGLLIPANERSFQTTCGQKLGPRDFLTVVLGPLILVTTKDRASIKVAGENVFAVTKEAGGIKISARVISSSNQVVAAISDNVLYVNPSNRFEMQRPDWHSLIIVDTHDQYKRRVLDVYFLNPSTVRVYGDFYVPGFIPLILGRENSQIGSNRIIGAPPNVETYCFRVYDGAPRSSMNLDGVNIVAE